jgi:8-oxo-dGTP diphosphatase
LVTVATLCFILKGREVLLLLKSEGRFGGGKWNGLGGKLTVGETPLGCVRREVMEESGLDVPAPEFHGTLYFRFGDDPLRDWLVHVYSTTEFRGEPKPSEEGELRWFPLRDIPYEGMWEDDRHWLPLVLKGATVNGRFQFDDGGTRLLSCEVEEADG